MARTLGLGSLSFWRYRNVTERHEFARRVRPCQCAGQSTHGRYAATQFRKRGYEMVDWICDYYTKLGSLPVRSDVQPGDCLAGHFHVAPLQQVP